MLYLSNLQIQVEGIMKVKAFIGNYDINLGDLHSDSLDDAYLYPKIIPSSIRIKLIEYANKNDMAELQAIVDIITKRFE